MILFTNIVTFLVMLASQNHLQYEQTSAVQDSIKTISFAAVGDLMCHGTQLKWAEVGVDTFDFKPVFSEVKKYLIEPDFTIGNFETITRKDRGYKGYPVFNTPIEFVEALEDAGFDFLTTTNNHATDGRKTGIIHTIENITKHNMHYIGSFLNEVDRDSVRVYRKNDIAFSILSYTYGVNIDNLGSGDNYLLNFIDTTLMRTDIKKARFNGADIVIVYLHLGHENHREPGREQKQISKMLMKFGVDVILSSSPHVIQPIDFVANANAHVDSTLIVNSLGNFISNQRWRYSDCGVIVNFDISKNLNKGKVSVSNVEFMPVWVYKGLIGSTKQYVIHPSEISRHDDYPVYFSEDDKNKMKQSFEDSELILTKYSSSPKLKSIYRNVDVVYDSITAPIMPFDLGN